MVCQNCNRIDRNPEQKIAAMSESEEARIAVLEARHAQHEKQFESMVRKVDEMHSILLQARGARWAILGAAGLAGFLSGKLSLFIATLSGKM